MEGPGSGVYRRIDFIFDEDGTYAGLALGAKAPAAITGTYEVNGDTLLLVGADGKRREWAMSFDGSRLSLRESSTSLLLERIR
jgi:hypothetical protein